MLYFVLSCLFLITIVLWWAEAKCNFIYRKIISLKNLCAWIKKQTKLEIDICKWFLPSVFIFFILFFLWNSLYFPYLKENMDIKDGVIQLKDYSKNESESQKKQSNQEENSYVKIELIKEDVQESQIGDWGTFGDFIGGTINPIIGLISVLLLFGTWRVTSNTLDVSKKELRNSNELLSNQQFDAIFWGLFHNLKRIEEILYKTGDYGQIKINEIYYDVFRCQFSNRDKGHSRRRDEILKNAELSQYFICLYQIFKNIEGRISLDNKEEEQKIKKAYSNILRASISTKLLQLLAVNCHENFKEYKGFLENYNFLEHMPFYTVDHEKHLNLGLLECLTTYDERIFDQSIYYKEFKEKVFLNVFFEKKIQNYKLYINNYLMKRFHGENFVENKNIDLKIYLDWDRVNFQLAWWGSYQGQEIQRQICSWYVSISGIEIQIGGLNYYLIINSFSNNLIELKENPL